jgi:hypothetical protein
MFDGVGARNGDRWAHLVGNEYDRVTPEVPTPANIQVLAHSPVVCRGRHSFSDMTYYTTDRGAAVFSSGSIWFERHLFPGSPLAVPPAIAMVTNMLHEFAAGPAGHTHPAEPNLERFGIRLGYQATLPPESDSAASAQTENNAETNEAAPPVSTTTTTTTTPPTTKPATTGGGTSVQSPAAPRVRSKT